MIKWLAMLCACAPFLHANAQVGAADQGNREFRKFLGLDAPQSLSQQFIVLGETRSARALSPSSANSSTNHQVVELQPAFLAISCERIKHALFRELGLDQRQWRGRIFINLHPPQNSDEAIIASHQYDGNWTYRMELPSTMEPSRLVTVVVDALLMEVANRNAEDHSAEIPAWLAQGLAQQIITSSQSDLVSRPPDRAQNGVAFNPVFFSGRLLDPLTPAKTELGNQPPLSLEALSWPSEEQLSGEAAKAYRSSAQLFVQRLLHLKDGQACLRAMLADLPRHYNWQISMLNAFRAHFASQLELEKWWTLQLVNFTGRDLSNTWPSDESWNKLDEIVRSSVQVRTVASEMPMRSEVSLQTIVREWDFLRQSEAFQVKLRQLLLLRYQVSQDLAGLVDKYRATLETYLKDRNQTGAVRALRGGPRVVVDKVAQETISQLNALDARREELRPAPNQANTPKAQTVSFNPKQQGDNDLQHKQRYFTPFP